MAADMSVEPWSRLARLAPPETDPNDLQAAADRYALTADLYAACADLWEERAMTIDLSPDSNAGTVQSVSQDGLSVTYASGDNQNARSAQYASYMSRARQYRAKSKVKSSLLDGRVPVDVYDPDALTDYYDPDHIIPVIE